MKRFFSNVMLVAAAATAFFSCQKQETFAPETSTQEVILTFASEKPAFDDETKTEWTGSDIQWSAGDKISVAYTVNGNWQNATGDASGNAKIYKSDPLKIADEVANFNVSASFEGTTEGVHVFYGVYPAPAETDFRNAPVAALEVPAQQTPMAASFDGDADLMTGVSVGNYTARPEDGQTISMKWTRLVAHANITLKALNGADASEQVLSIKLTAQDEAKLVGNLEVDLLTNEVGKDNASNVIEINGSNLAIDKDGNIEFWACLLPETLTSLNVVVETNKATYTRDITGISKTFARNARNTLAIKMDKAERIEKVATAYYKKVTSQLEDWSGQYLIVFGNNAHATLDSKDLIATVAVAIDGDKIAASDDYANAVMTVTKSGDKYNMTYPNGKYFAMAHNSSSSSTSAFDLEFSYTDNGVKIIGYVAAKETNYILYNNNNQYYRCYVDKNGQSGYVLPTLYRLSESNEGGGETPEPEPQEPYIRVSQEEFNVPATQTSVTFNVEANVGWGVEHTEGVTDVKIIEVSEDELVMTVEATFGENESDEPQTHTITFIPEELDETVTVTINQDAKVEVDDSFEAGDYWIVANGKYAMPVTSNYDYLKVDDAGYKDNVFTFKKVENGYTIQQSDDKYLYMKGTYNNFNVSATAPTEGHIWTIAKNEDGSYKILNVLMSKYIQLDSQYGTYGSYDAVKGTMPNLVPADDAKDRPVFSVTPTSKSVACDVIEASFDIVSNQNWTVVAGEGVTVDVTSGSGNGTITMTFAENKSEENVIYTAIVKADGLEDIVLTVVQSGIPTGDVTETVVDLTWTLGANAYDNTTSQKQTATINGVEYSNLLKLGTSSKSGSASIKLPAGTTKVTYSAVAWKGASCTLKFTVGGTNYTQKISANSGATGNPKYTINSTSEDNYELVVSVDQETTMTVTTTTAVRAILWDLKAVVVN